MPTETLFMSTLLGSPFKICSNLKIVSAKLTYLPGEPVNTAATTNGCDKKRSTLRALANQV